MTPALFLVPDLGSGRLLELLGAEARHAATVKRVELGEIVLLADGRGGLAEARAVEISRERILFEVLTRRVEPAPDPRFVVVQALPKGERADLAVEALTELGVDEIVPWSAARSIVQWRGADKVDKGVLKWRRTALEAAKQSRRSRIPEVSDLADSTEVADRIAAAAAAFILHEQAEFALATRELPTSGEIVVVVGPEGGIDDAEIDRFRQAGGLSVKLGPQVLRTSTAGAAALAVLSVGARRWS